MAIEPDTGTRADCHATAILQRLDWLVQIWSGERVEPANFAWDKLLMEQPEITDAENDAFIAAIRNFAKNG